MRPQPESTRIANLAPETTNDRFSAREGVQFSPGLTCVPGTWRDGRDGGWRDATNWRGLAPSPSRRAILGNGRVSVRGAGAQCMSLAIGSEHLCGVCRVEGTSLTVREFLEVGAEHGSLGHMNICDASVAAEIASIGERGRGVLALAGSSLGSKEAPVMALVIGNAADGRGSVTLRSRDGALSGLYARSLVVGHRGKGELNAEKNGAEIVVDGPVELGKERGSAGVMSVAGAGADLAFAARSVKVGVRGHGSLHVRGRSLISGSLSVGGNGGEGVVEATSASAEAVSLPADSDRVSDAVLTVRGSLKLGSPASERDAAGRATLRIQGEAGSEAAPALVVDGTLDSPVGGASSIELAGSLRARVSRLYNCRIEGSGRFQKHPIPAAAHPILLVGEGSSLRPRGVARSADYGTIHVDGPVTAAAATLSFRIGAPDSTGRVCDVIESSGEMNLGGSTIQVELAASGAMKTLKAGQIYVLARASDITGAAATLQLPAAPKGLAFALVTGATEISLRVIRAA